MNEWTCPYCGHHHPRVDLGPVVVAACSKKDE